MREHRYIVERHGRKTYLKGSFTGRFVGRLDPYRSDAKHERFFDIEVTEGEITSRHDQVTPWQEGAEDPDFANESTFQVRLPGQMPVTLQYPDGSVKHFKVSLKQIKLIRCGLSEKTYYRDEVRGIIRGDVSGYLLHHDTAMDEIKEYPGRPIIKPPPPPEVISTGGGPGIITNPLPPAASFDLSKVAVISALALLGATLAVSNTWWLALCFFLLGGLGVGWLYKGLSGKLRPQTGQLAAILLFCLLFAGGLGWLFSHTLGGEKKTPAQIISLAQRGETLLAEKNYRQALRVFDTLIDNADAKAEFLYKRAICYLGLGNVEEALDDLKPVVDQGDSAAARLYTLVNPKRKTQIRCRDGTISHSKHRSGTCSHHGGVKDWAEPVYE